MIANPSPKSTTDDPNISELKRKMKEQEKKLAQMESLLQSHHFQSCGSPIIPKVEPNYDNDTRLGHIHKMEPYQKSSKIKKKQVLSSTVNMSKIGKMDTQQNKVSKCYKEYKLLL